MASLVEAKYHTCSNHKGTHNPERATSMHLCHGVFTDQFIFRTVLAQIFEYLVNSTNQSVKPKDLDIIFFAF